MCLLVFAFFNSFLTQVLPMRSEGFIPKLLMFHCRYFDALAERWQVFQYKLKDFNVAQKIKS